jgi:hypothetical protein
VQLVRGLRNTDIRAAVKGGTYPVTVSGKVTQHGITLAPQVLQAPGAGEWQTRLVSGDQVTVQATDSAGHSAQATATMP